MRDTVRGASSMPPSPLDSDCYALSGFNRNKGMISLNSEKDDIIEHMVYDNKLDLLTQQMALEPAEDWDCPQISDRKQKEFYATRARLPNGKPIFLLKTLLSSVCERNCLYCPFRAGRDFRRASFQPEEFAKIFMFMHKTGKVDGIFLSSGITNGGIYSQDKLLQTAELLRHRFGYQDYLHLKILPGAEYSQVEQAMQLADRISINLEAPNSTSLKKLAPEKQFQEELLRPLQWADRIRKEKYPNTAWKGKWPSTATQFVVGGADESDFELLDTTSKLLMHYGLTRVYFSAFNPILDTPLESKSPTPLLRQHRLYQASYLLRDYQFNFDELSFTQSGNLPLETDPKTAWAIQNIKEQPIEINTASKEMLLRVPGIGPKGVFAILIARRERKLRSLSTLEKLGIQSKKAAPYILLDGKKPPVQPQLFII
jgi:predicted DNA-binding helix-hairpin-helix protein